MSDLRIKALELAHNAGDTPAVVVKRAEAYLTFLAASTALTAPTPTASPLAEPEGTEPARLDDPKVVEQAKAVVESPTVTGDAVEPQPEPEPTPVTETPAAGATGDVPPIGEVNAAVLAFNRKNGREKTVALLAKYGGSKVPEIDASKHADLLAELKAGVA